MKKKCLAVLGLLFFMISFGSRQIYAEFQCDPNNSCLEPISQVSCILDDNPLPGRCNATSGTYYNVASCDEFDHQQGGLNYFKRHYFRIRKITSNGRCGSTGWVYSHTWSQTGSTNTGVLPNSCSNDYAEGEPAGCNQGIQPPQGGPSPTQIPPGSCPAPWGLQQPINCNIVPCEHKNVCGCDCTNPPCSPGQCSGGPPPPPTATPTPTPFCRLFCPGQQGYISQMGGNGGGVQTIDFQPTPILPTQAIGQLYYFGFNGFVCGTFDDAKTYPKLCPAGSSGGLGNDIWTYPTPTNNPLKYNMLCGNQTHIYTAIVNAGQRTGAYGGSTQGGPTATTAPTPTFGIYPPGCFMGTPTPTPDGGTQTVADQDAGALREQGGVMGADANSCSCSVAVGCQTSLQSLPSQTGVSCDANCDFTVNPETPEFGDQVTYTATGAGVDGSSTFTFDDNTDPVAANAGPVTRAFANSGVYRVSLSCNSGAQTCTRTVNNYCGPLSWYKIKNASFHKNNALNNPIPASITAFDADDTTQALTSIGSAGLVTTTGSITTGAGNLSTPNWRSTLYTPNTTFTPTAYADYVVARKTYSTISDANSNGIIDSGELTANATNYIVGNYTIDNNSVQSKAPVVIVVRGNLTINSSSNEFNPPDKAMVFIVTGTLRIHSHHDQINGIYIATSVDLAYDVASTTTPLKVVGNLISHNTINLMKRVRTDGARPSFFIVQEYKHYLNTLNMVGISKYTQTELRP